MRVGSASLFVVLSCATKLSSFLPAQQSLDEFFLPAYSHVPWTPDVSSRLLCVGDFDGDGDADTLVRSDGVRLYRNSGAGEFVRESSQLSVAEFGLVVPVDADDDGDLDLIVSESAVGGFVARNDGSGAFTVVLNSIERVGGGTDQLEVVDFDGDGDMDFIASVHFELRAFENDGNGIFSVVTGAFGSGAAPRPDEIAVGDVDGDGDPDVVANIQLSPAQLYRNDGAGSFSAETLTGIPAGLAVVDFALGDLDADQDLDLVVATPDPSVFQNDPGVTRVLMNDGSGVFSAGPTFDGTRIYSSSHTVEIVETDGDGRPDILDFGTQGSIVIRKQVSAGQFEEVSFFDSRFTFELARPRLLTADLDGDLDLDLLFQRSFDERDFGYWINFGGGQLVRASGGSEADLPSGATSCADVDGDGDDDCILPTPAGVTIVSDDGRGGFSEEHIDLPFSSNYFAAADDLDGDGRAEVVVLSGGTSFARPPLLVEFQPDGTYAVSSIDLFSMFGRRALIRDFDGDGLKGFLALGSRVRVVEQSSPGTFSISGFTFPVVEADVAEAADFDGDGELEVVAQEIADSSSSASFEMYARSGGAYATVPNRLLGTQLEPVEALLALDVDEDGDVDLLVADRESVFVWENDGIGTLSKRSDPFLTLPADSDNRQLACRDLDDDGDQDLLIAAQATHVFRCDGAGVYELVGVFEGSEQFAAGDLDGDLDVDLVFPFRTMRNRQRHASAAFVLRPGWRSRWEYHVVSRGLFGGGSIAPIFAAGEAATPILTPFGQLELDLGSAVFLPTIPIGEGGIARVPFGIPDDVALVDVEISTQAVTVREGQLRLTNSVTRRIGR